MGTSANPACRGRSPSRWPSKHSPHTIAPPVRFLEAPPGFSVPGQSRLMSDSADADYFRQDAAVPCRTSGLNLDFPAWIPARTAAPHDQGQMREPRPSRPGPAEPSSAPTLAADLLGVIGDMAPESLDLDTCAFRADPGKIAEQVTSAPRGIDGRVVANMSTCATASWAGAGTSGRAGDRVLGAYCRPDRDGRDAGRRRHFNDQLDRSAERLHKIVDINDVRILKRRLTVEIETLKRLSVEKRAQDSGNKTYFSTEIERLQMRLAQSMEEASIDQLTQRRQPRPLRAHAAAVASRAPGQRTSLRPGAD